LKKIILSLGLGLGLALSILVSISSITSYANDINLSNFQSISSSIWFTNQNTNSYYANWSVSTIATKIFPKVTSRAYVYKGNFLVADQFRSDHNTSSVTLSGQNSGNKSIEVEWTVIGGHLLYNSSSSTDPSYIDITSDSAIWTPGIEPESVIETIKNRLARDREAVKTEFLSSFNFSLDDFHILDTDKLVLFAKGNKTFNNYYFSMDMSIGDLIPYVYINKDKDHIYILQKKKDGKNILHELKFIDEEWKLVNKKLKDGNI
jgi:hypothetical protein